MCLEDCLTLALTPDPLPRGEGRADWMFSGNPMIHLSIATLWLFGGKQWTN